MKIQCLGFCDKLGSPHRVHQGRISLYPIPSRRLSGCTSRLHHGSDGGHDGHHEELSGKWHKVMCQKCPVQGRQVVRTARL